MKIYGLEVITDTGRRSVQPPAPVDIDPIGEMPPHFRSLTEQLWCEGVRDPLAAKIACVSVETNLGRRVVKLSAPIDVDPRGDIPPHFRSLIEMLWGLLREVAAQRPSPTSPRAEA